MGFESMKSYLDFAENDYLFFVDVEDIENSADAVKLTRQFVYDTIRQLNSNNPIKLNI